MQALLDVILPVFLVIGAGYIAIWTKFFNDAQIDGLMKFAQNFAIPVLLFKSLAFLDLSASFNVPLLASFYIGAISGFLLGLAGARLIFDRSWPDSVAIGFCCLFSNSVLLGLAITERAYGVEALAGNFAIIAFHAPVCYFIGVTAMEIVKGSGAGTLATIKNITSSMFRNALLVGIGLGILVNLLSIQVPGSVINAVDLISRAALPVAIFALGGVLVRYKPEGDLKIIGMVCVISLVIHPTISFALATGLGLDRDALRSVVLTAAMAPGANAYIFANMYGTAMRVSASSVLIATGLTVLTAWCWLLIIP